MISDVETKTLGVDGTQNDEHAKPQELEAKQQGQSEVANSTKPLKAEQATSGKKKSKSNSNTRQSIKRASQKKSANIIVSDGNLAKYPRHTVEKALRIPRAIIDQNAGRECSERDAATFAGLGSGGPTKVEISSAIKYGFLERPKPGHLLVTNRARQAIRPQNPGDEIEALRQAIMDAPDISAVYKHYRGENLPDGLFFSNALTDKFGIPAAKVAEFNDIY